MNWNVLINQTTLAITAISFGFWTYFTIYYVHVLRKHDLRPTRKMSIKALAWISANVAATSLVTALYRIDKLDVNASAVSLDVVRIIVTISFLLSGIYVYKVDKKLSKSLNELHEHRSKIDG